jgi:acetyl-CoA C-acetyltransferase
MSRGAYLAENHRWGQRMGNSELIDAVTGGLTDPFDDYPMGITAENVAAKWGISREEQDALAVDSHRRAAQAAAGGYFKEQILPVLTTTSTSGQTPTSTRWRGSVRSSRRTAP